MSTDRDVMKHLVAIDLAVLALLVAVTAIVGVNLLTGGDQAPADPDRRAEAVAYDTAMADLETTYGISILDPDNPLVGKVIPTGPDSYSRVAAVVNGEQTDCRVTTDAHVEYSVHCVLDGDDYEPLAPVA